MKKSIKMLLMVFAVAFGVLLVSGPSSKAAEAWNAGLKQTDTSTSGVTLQWGTYLGDVKADYYNIYVGESRTSLKWFNRVTSSTTSAALSLTAGRIYYVQIVPSYMESLTSEIELAESEIICVGVKPVVNAVTALQQTAATTDSITMSWTAVSGATSYDVYRYNSYNDYTIVGKDVTSTSYKATGLSASTTVSYFVLAKQKVTADGLMIPVEGQSALLNTKIITMKTTPGKVPLIAMSSYSDSANSASFSWNSVNNVDGYQFQLLNSSGKSLLSKETSKYTTSITVNPFKKGVFTKARARGYITVGNQKIYGAWSDYTFNASNKKITVKRSANGKKITVNWKKITGATGYKVLISTKSGSGYKNVKTLGKKKTSITITKCGKKKLSKKKTYYIRLQYLIKSGKKTITSQIVGSGSI